MVEFHGEFYDFDKLQMSPAPTEPVPFYVGGHTDVALRRAVRIGDGWTSAMMTCEQAARPSQARELLAERPRPRPIRVPSRVHRQVRRRRSPRARGGRRHRQHRHAMDVRGLGFDAPLQAKQDSMKRFADTYIHSGWQQVTVTDPDAPVHLAGKRSREAAIAHDKQAWLANFADDASSRTDRSVTLRPRGQRPPRQGGDRGVLRQGDRSQRLSSTSKRPSSAATRKPTSATS